MTGDEGKTRFRELMVDVKPIEQDRIAPAKPRDRRAAPPGEAARTPRFEAVDFSEPPASFHAGGLQHTVLRRLRRGDIRPSTRLDLHGYRRDRAQRLLDAFVNEAAARGEQCVLIIHGKGSRSEARVAVLRQMVRAVLMRDTRVLAYCPATHADGGEGALYAYLKKPYGG